MQEVMFVRGLMVTAAELSVLHSVLRDGEIRVTGRLVDASNATLYACAFKNELEVACIYKPVAGERPLWDFASGTLADREYAAYLISESSGLSVVPLTILRDGPFGRGMVQLWIDIDETVDLVELFQKDLPQLRKIALFDAIVNNTDRKIGHLLPTTDDEILGCDHGVTFHESDKLRTVLWQWAGVALFVEEIALLQRLLDNLEQKLGKQLLDHVTELEVIALKSRVMRLLNDEVFPLPSKDWPAVPWPAY